MVLSFRGVRPAQTVYFKQICKCDDTAVNVHLTPRHITDLELLTWTWNKQSHCSKFSLPQGMLFIITSSRQRGFAHGIASFMRRRCVFIFLFIYLHLLYRVFEKEKKKNPCFWGKLRSCTKCSEKQAGWNNLKCQHAVTGCSIKIQEDAILYFLHLFHGGLFFVCIKILSVGMQNLQDKCQALNSMTERRFWGKKKKKTLQTYTTKY